MIHEIAHEVLGQLVSAGHIYAMPREVPDPGDGVPPPDFDKVLLLLGWIKWLVAAAAVAGGMFIAGKMVVAHRRGDDAHVGTLGVYLAGVILLGAAPAIITALT